MEHEPTGALSYGVLCLCWQSHYLVFKEQLRPREYLTIANDDCQSLATANIRVETRALAPILDIKKATRQAADMKNSYIPVAISSSACRTGFLGPKKA